MNVETLIANSTPFLSWLTEWQADRPTLDLAAEIGDPTAAAVLATDVVNGFCYEGPLASPRVAAIVPPIVALFRRAHELGVPHFLLTSDTHSEDALEFQQWGPHCIAGSREAEMVPELAALPFADQFVTIPKNSLNAALGTSLDEWLDDHPEVTTFIVTGDCTDLCVYQLAMHLRLRANVLGLARRIIVPANAVDTFDVPVDTARELGIMPHDGDLLHLIFLYHMALNGIEVVAGVR